VPRALRSEERRYSILHEQLGTNTEREGGGEFDIMKR